MSGVAVVSVLVVEKDRAMRDLLADLLRENGFRVTSASALASARAMIIDIRMGFDLILLAVRLVDGDGLDFARELKSFDRGMRVIVMTGNTADWQRAAGVGAIAVLKKPFTIGDLLEEIEATLDDE